MRAEERRQRLEEWMLRLRDEFIALLTDHDTYWKTQNVIKQNAQLMTMRSPFFDLFNDSYVHSTVMTLRRITERSSQVISLTNVLDELQQYPGLAAGIDSQHISSDIKTLEGLGQSARAYADKFIAHHDRQRKPTQLTFGDLRRSVEAVRDMFQRYYAEIMKSDVDLVVSYLEDPMRIFAFAWIGEGERGKKSALSG